MAVAHDLDILSRTIYGEARGQTLRGQFAVGWVIKNRFLHGERFKAGSIMEVCLKPKQFSCWNVGDPNLAIIQKVTIDNVAYLQTVGVAALVISGASVDPTHGADHYFTVARPKGVKTWPPAWSARMEAKITIGAHIFFKE